MAYGLLSKDYVNLTYQEDNSINYKVYLKENNYFETPYLGENRTYIASLIDYIDIDYKYLINFDQKISGKYNYYVVASVDANKPNGEDGNYWHKEYQLTKPETIEVKDTSSFLITKNIKVDYDEYNTILNSFKKEYSMQTDGLLTVSLKVESSTNNEVFTKNIDIASDLKLSMPLLQQTVEASISKDAVSQSKVVSMLDESNRPFYAFCKVLGFVIILFDIVYLINVIRYTIKKSKKNIYKTTLTKILRNHDSIIANINTLPNTDDLNVIEIATFEELLDVYNEVRMPINYYQDYDYMESTFMIINDGIAWIYKLNKEDIEDDNKESISKEKVDRK